MPTAIDAAAAIASICADEVADSFTAPAVVVTAAPAIDARTSVAISL